MGPSFTLLSATVPAAGTRSLEITHAGAVVASRSRRVRAPYVRVLAPRRGASIDRCSRARRTCAVRVRWRTTGGHGALAFIDLSSDDGGHWRTLWIGADRGSATLSNALFGHTRSGRIRVRVNDGFDESTAVSGAFTAIGHPPAVAIVSPRAGEHLVSDASLYLAGSARDDSGRVLSGGSLRWYVGRSLVGSGPELVTTRLLPKGNVRVRLVARDARGRSASAAIDIRVSR
jgi:hypothetical protein